MDDIVITLCLRQLEQFSTIHTWAADCMSVSGHDAACVLRLGKRCCQENLSLSVPYQVKRWIADPVMNAISPQRMVVGSHTSTKLEVHY